MLEISDEDLMLSVRNGKIADLAFLFERYKVKLYNFFLKLTGDETASEDLTQQLFMRVMNYRHTFDTQQGSFKAWIYRMARNSFYDFNKEKQKQNERFTSVEDKHEQLPDNDNGYSEEDYENLDIAIAKLPLDQREMIVMSRYQGLKYEEISRITDISVPAIKVRIHRAIKELKVIYFNQ